VKRVLNLYLMICVATLNLGAAVLGDCSNNTVKNCCCAAVIEVEKACCAEPEPASTDDEVCSCSITNNNASIPDGVAVVESDSFKKLNIAHSVAMLSTLTLKKPTLAIHSITAKNDKGRSVPSYIMFAVFIS